MTERFYIDGDPVPVGRFVVSGSDPGLTVGVTAFETLRTYHGRLFRPDHHAARLVGSAEVVGVPCPSAEQILDELRGAVSEPAPPGVERCVRMTLTPHHRLVHVTPLDTTRVRAPLQVATRRWEPAPWLPGTVKHGSRATSEVARRLAEADEVFWVGLDGCFTEATRSSIFAAVDGVMVTPPIDGRILDGVTRAALLDAGRHEGIPVAEASIRLDAPMTELYATSTLKELAPVERLDGEPAPGGGPLGTALAAAYRRLVERECR